MIAEGFRGEHIVQRGCSVMSLTYSEAHGHCLHPRVPLRGEGCCGVGGDSRDSTGFGAAVHSDLGLVRTSAVVPSSQILPSSITIMRGQICRTMWMLCPDLNAAGSQLPLAGSMGTARQGERASN